MKIIIDGEVDYHVGEMVSITLNHTKYLGRVIAIEHNEEKHLYTLECEHDWDE